MKINLYLSFLSFLCFLFSLYVFSEKKGLKYSKQLYQLINDNTTSNEVVFKKIKIENKNFDIHYIKNIENQKTFNELGLVQVIKPFTGYPGDIPENGVLVRKVYNEYKTYDNVITISSQKYFNKLIFIFANEEINEKEIKEIIKTEMREDVFKYLIKPYRIINCKIINISNKKIKKCEEIHHFQLTNYDLPYQIFNTYNYFYFKIDNEYLKFKNEQL